MAEPLQRGDIVRFMRSYLGIVGDARDCTGDPVSGQSVSIDYLGYECPSAFGQHVGVLDAAEVEFMAKGVLPDAPVEALGMEHPWIMARFQARIDASFARSDGVPFREALAAAERRAVELFDGAPSGWVATAVAQVYADCACDRQNPIERIAS